MKTWTMSERIGFLAWSALGLFLLVKIGLALAGQHAVDSPRDLIFAALLLANVGEIRALVRRTEQPAGPPRQEPIAN